MKRRLVTFSVELYDRENGDFTQIVEAVREEIQERLAITGEWGNGYTTKAISIGEPLPDEPEEEEDVPTFSWGKR